MICKKCNTDKEDSEFYRRKNGKLRSSCKVCVRQRAQNTAKAYKEANQNYISITSKVCSRCKEEKAASEFYIRRRAKDGLDPYCKCCSKEYVNLLNKKHKDEKAFLEFNTCMSCNIEKPSSEFPTSSRNKYGISNRCKSCTAIYNKKQDSSPNGRYHAYKSGAKARNVSFSLTKSQFIELWQKPCTYCGDSIETIGIDRVDNSIGYTIENIVPCCFTCNSMKKTQSLSDFKTHIEKLYNNLIGDSEE